MISIEGNEQFDSVGEAVAALLRAWKSELVAFAVEHTPGLSRGAGDFIVDIRPQSFTVSRTDGRTEHVVGSVPRDAAAPTVLVPLLHSVTTFRDVSLRLDPALVLRPTVRLPHA